MKPTFTTPCFIRKNTPELRKKLEEFGYKVMLNDETYREPKLYAHYGYVFIIPGIDPDAIDCGENEDLFLALAALREDTDKHQWFIYDTMDCIDEKRRMREFFQCTEESIEDMMIYDCAFLSCRKATVEELIEHFKKQII